MTEDDIIEKSNQYSPFTEMSHEIEQMQKPPAHACYSVR